MMNWIPVLGAFTAVGGMIAFLVYCGKEIDAEAERVEKHRVASGHPLQQNDGRSVAFRIVVKEENR